MEQTPGHCADLIEELERILDTGPVDRSNLGEEPEVAVGFLGRGVVDPPQVRSVTTGPALSLGQVCRNRAGRADHLNDPEAIMPVPAPAT